MNSLSVRRFRKGLLRVNLMEVSCNRFTRDIFRTLVISLMKFGRRDY